MPNHVSGIKGPGYSEKIDQILVSNIVRNISSGSIAADKINFASVKIDFIYLVAFMV